MKPTTSLAAIWLKNGHTAVARSFRFHRQRGAFCHRGWCQQCKTRLPDGTVVLACTTAASGKQEESAPDHRTDPLRLLGALAERTRPWFFERQTLGGPVQQAFLKTLRWMSGAFPLPTLRSYAAKARTSTLSCQTLVIGGGPAGSLAADALARAGRSCVVIHAGDPGGSARTLFAGVTPWPVVVDRASNIKRLDRHLCVGLYDEARRALCVGPNANVLVTYDEIVVATGAYDRMPTVEGNDLPGVVGLRAFERLAAQGAIPVGSKVGIYAAAAEARRARAAAEAAGVNLAFVEDADAKALRRIVGRKRVTGIALEDGTVNECNLLIVGFTQPSYEFQAQNGCTVELAGQPPIVRARGASKRPMLVVGEARGWTDPDTLASNVQTAVAAWLTGKPSVEQASTPASRSMTQRPGDAAFVCFCEDVRVGDIRAAIADGYDDVELVKRHTGAGTGPCQGKLCHASLLSCMEEAGHEVRIPTPRPLLRPIALRQLAGDGSIIGK
jgi:sarcosine oxidase subunit alpha